MSFTHLQVRSGYSFLNSTITIDKLIKYAIKLRVDALALTDEHVMYGTIPFYKACMKAGIKPIIGMILHTKDIYDRPASLILLSKDNTGYKQLLSLSTYIQENDLDYLSKEELVDFQAGLIGILLPLDSPLQEMLISDTYENVEDYVKSWKHLFNEGDFYIGVTDHGQDIERKIYPSLKAYHQTYQTPVVAVSDVRYLESSDDIAYDCLQALKKGIHWKKETIHPERKQRHLRPVPEMNDLFSDWPEVLHETEVIRNKCSVTLDFDQQLLPRYPVPDGYQAHAYLEKICWENASFRYTEVTEDVSSRLKYELAVIQSMQYSDYFLIVWDFIKYAKQRRILVGPGRGSSAGSIVAYVLGITDVDPLRYDLLFERFLNPERTTMPDIDVDFSDHRRDEVIQYVQEKYGRAHVAQITTFGTFQVRSLLRELMKTLGIDEQDVHYILKQIPQQSSEPVAQVVRSSTELKKYVQRSEQLKTLFSIANKLEGLPRNVSTHAAGVVICDDPLVNHVPLASGSNGIHVTQYPMNDLEAIGLLKMDFLGLRNLTILEHIQTSIKKSTGKAIALQDIPQDDQDTYALLQTGKTNGIFQLESNGMKNVLKRLKPSRFDDIVAVNALYRPGPMDYISVYIDRKQKRQEVTYPHPDLEPILRNTYGVLIYQEQIMLIASQIAGFRLGEADLLRRAVSKKKHGLMEEQQAAFINGCMQNGYDRRVAEEIFAWIVKFSNYGFPRSHAVAYSKIAYQLAYFKAHFPADFYCELLSSLWNQQEKIRSYVQEIKSLQISLYPPSINHSFGKYTVEGDAVRMGLLSIKGVGHQVISAIISERKKGVFKSLFDFCLRVPKNLVNRKTMELLILAGAFDILYDNRASLLASLDQAMEQGELFREFNDQPQLFQDKISLEDSYMDIDDFSKMKRLADEKELFGFYISTHPLVDYRKQLSRRGYINLNESMREIGKRQKQSVVVVQSIKTIRTKRGDPMAFLTISDETSEMEAVVFPDLYREVHRFLEEEMMIEITGKIESRNNTPQWILAKIEPSTGDSFQKEGQDTDKRLFIRYPKNEHHIKIQVIQSIAKSYPGNIPIIVYHEEVKETYQLHESYNVSADEDCLFALRKRFGEKNVILGQ